MITLGGYLNDSVELACTYDMVHHMIHTRPLEPAVYLSAVYQDHVLCQKYWRASLGSDTHTSFANKKSTWVGRVMIQSQE